MPSWAQPTDQEIDRAVGRLTRPELSAYFFRNLKNPLWLEALRARGFFDSPPAPQARGKEMYAPLWPPADYLRQVAPEAPDDVASIIASISTENWIVQLALVEAALKLPPSGAATLVAHLGSWMRAKYRHPLLPDRLADLVARLAEGTETKAAIALAKGLLQLRPPKRREADSYFQAEPEGLVDV